MKRCRKSTVYHCAIVAAAAATGGCVGLIQETHFLKTEAGGKTINYFRVDVSGQAVAAQARYVSGFYSPRAVETYFGTFAQPTTFPSTNGSTVKTTLVTDEAADKAMDRTSETGEVKVCQLGGKEDGRLVLLLSSNSDSVAEALGALAENEAMAKTIVQLTHADAYKSAGASDQTAGKQEAVAAKVSAAAGAIDGLTDASTKDDVKATLLRTANEIAGALGEDKLLLSFEDAAKLATELQKGGVK